jgi:hypothetical protein
MIFGGETLLSYILSLLSLTLLSLSYLCLLHLCLCLNRELSKILLLNWNTFEHNAVTSVLMWGIERVMERNLYIIVKRVLLCTQTGCFWNRRCHFWVLLDACWQLKDLWTLSPWNFRFVSRYILFWKQKDKRHGLDQSTYVSIYKSFITALLVTVWTNVPPEVFKMLFHSYMSRCATIYRLSLTFKIEAC